MSRAPGPVLVMGTGAVGGYLGGRLQAAGADVHFVGRDRVLDALAAGGLRLSDLDGLDTTIDAAALRLHRAVPEDMRPSLALLCVKSGATAEAATRLGERLPPGTPVVSMQNGVRNAEVAQAAAPALKVLPGMVPFNVAELAPGHWHRGTSGTLAAQDDPALREWQPVFERAGIPLALHADLRPLQWGKLLLNLNNPINALSGLPLRAQLLDAGYRRLFAAVQREALAVMKTAGVRPAKVSPLPPRWLPIVLSLPTPLFQRLASRMLRIDAQARSSMADDLQAGRPTEIDAICGEVVRLAERCGVDAPMSRRLVELLSAPAPERLDARALARALKS